MIKLYDRDQILSDLCFELKLSDPIKERAISILDMADRKSDKLGFITEVSKISAAIYISSILCGERRTQKEVCDQMGITLVTLGKSYRRMAETIDIEMLL